VKHQFYKAESAGNDFIVVVTEDSNRDEFRSAAPLWCDRRKGIGADGMIAINASVNPAGFGIYNADGSEAEISGNGLMCAAALLSRLNPALTGSILFQTKTGTRAVVHEKGESFAVDLGRLPEPAEFDSFVYREGGRAYEFFCTRFPGNPHAILVGASAGTLSDEFPLIAPKIETLRRFPDRTNVEFVHPVSDSVAEVRVWERGVGETLSCGSGAAAISALLYHRGGSRFPVELRFPGGSLFGDVRQDKVFISGRVRLVFEGDCF
jgi:diaminopimelate epimerase